MLIIFLFPIFSAATICAARVLFLLNGSGIAILVCVSYGVCFGLIFVTLSAGGSSCSLAHLTPLLLSFSFFPSTTTAAKLAGQACAVPCVLSLLPVLLDLITCLDVCCWDFHSFAYSKYTKNILSLAHTLPESLAIKHVSHSSAHWCLCFIWTGTQVALLWSEIQQPLVRLNLAISNRFRSYLHP
ncbi:hypothetical protein E4T42_01796 [Aureobasidium subglaciale]|nr:hypothetical protein E4T42_01796 [Aureobasidium subglaciale]